MKRIAQLVVAVALVPGLALAQSRRRPRPSLWDSLSECPLEVSVACFERCSQGGPAADCPLAAFSCDFKICWADPHVHVAREDLVRVVGSPSSYALADSAVSSDTVNLISVVRFTAGGGNTLYFMRDRFVLDIDGLATPAEGRASLQRAQACARLWRGQRPTRTNPDAVYRVVCGTDRVALREVAPAPAEEAAVGQARPDVAPQTGGANNGGGGAASPWIAPGRSAQQTFFDGLRTMSDQDLRAHLEGTGHFRVDGSGRLLLDGIVPYSPRTAPEDAQRVLESLDPEGRGAFKELYSRTASQTVTDAQSSSPAPAGQMYRYNPDTGRADLEAQPIKGPQVSGI